MIRFKLKKEQRHPATRNNKIHSYWKIEDFIDIFNSNYGTVRNPKILNSIKVKMPTLKNRIIANEFNKKGYCECAICGLKAEYMVLESNITYVDKKPKPCYFFNLYSFDREKRKEMLFNVDHIHPLSKGGRNVIENIQLTCEDCNSKKSNKVVKNVKSKKIWDYFKYIYNKIIGKNEIFKIQRFFK